MALIHKTVTSNSIAGTSTGRWGTGIVKVLILIVLSSTLVHGKVNYHTIIPPLGTITIFRQNQVGDSENENLVLEIQTQASAFKMEYPVHNQVKMEGFIVESVPNNACHSINSPPLSLPYSIDPTFTPLWIVIVNNLDCPYKNKVNYASSAGYNAIIVYNNNITTNGNETQFEIMGIQRKGFIELPIPAYSVKFHDGTLLKNAFNYKLGFFVKIYTPYSLYEIIMPIIIWIGLAMIIVIFATGLLRLFIPWSIYRKFQNHMKKLGLLQFINAIPVVRWTTDVKNRFEICVICLEDFTEGDFVRVLNCQHGFHKVCIDSWFLKARLSCPLCKQVFKYSTIYDELPEMDIEGEYLSHHEDNEQENELQDN